LGMEVVDPTGNVVGSGERFRVVARLGETLYVHIFGNKDLSGVAGAGAYTLDIDTLPQVADVEAQNLLPGQGTQPGGPTTSLVLVFQGDRLDADLAMDPKNYTVTWAGADGLFGTQDDQQIAVGDGLPSGSQTVVYDPSSNLDVASGLTYPTAIRQTVTLLFGTALPAGNYRITVSANVVSADFSLDEQDLLSSRDGFTSHPVVSVSHASVQEGATLTEQDLVQPSSALGDLDVFEGGTRFLTQFHNDLGALLDVQLTASGSGSTATQQLLNQILARFGPALGPAEQRLVSLLVVFLDPASFLLDDPNGRSFSYNLQKNSVANNLPQTFVEVGGNVEVIVIPNPIGTYHMQLADVAASARGGAVFFGNLADQAAGIGSLTTEAIDSGDRNFTFTFDSTSNVDAAALGQPSMAESGMAALPTSVLLTASSTDSALVAGISNFLSAAPIATAEIVADAGGSAPVVPPDALAQLWEPISTMWSGLSRRFQDRAEPDHMDPSDALPDVLQLLDVWRLMTPLMRGMLPANGLAKPSPSPAAPRPQAKGHPDAAQP
jgi:hypothetical protein